MKPYLLYMPFADIPPRYLNTFYVISARAVHSDYGGVNKVSLEVTWLEGNETFSGMIDMEDADEEMDWIDKIQGTA